MKEFWKDVKGFEGLYLISNLGNCKSLTITVIDKNGHKRHLKGNVLHTNKNSSGYYCYMLTKEGKHYNKLVHRLVAQAFIPNPDKLPQINHKDEDKSNNVVTNLEWVTSEANMNYGSRPLLYSKPIAQYKLNGQLVKIWPSTKEAGRYGFRSSDISRVANGFNHTAFGYFWKFI